MLFERLGFSVSAKLHGGWRRGRRISRFGFKERKQIRNRCRQRTGSLGRLKKRSLGFRGARRIKKHRLGCNWFHRRGNHRHFRNGVNWRNRKNWNNRWKRR